jgi:hypothetical protein
VQRSPFYTKETSDLIFQDEQDAIARLIADGRALLVAEEPNPIPSNYRVVRELRVPAAVPYLAPITLIAVPYAKSNDSRSVEPGSDLSR